MQNRWRYRSLLILLLGAVAGSFNLLSSQCIYDSTFLVEPIDTLEITLEVKGLVNNDLADPAQGVCGIRLEFVHDYLGDIYIELISPSGQTVRLIGPEITSGFTNLSRWNVLFVPCGFPTAPDPGFSSRWNNDQGWGILNSFNGTYHPFSGCLEDFDMGPANGDWRLRIVDRSQFYGGEIRSVTLIFCDPEGLDCVPCEADAGSWTGEGLSLEICEGDGGLLLDSTVTFSSGIPDPATYGYAWVISDPDTVRGFLERPDLRAFLPGEYTICGISFRSDELPAFQEFIDDLRIDSLKRLLESDRGGACGVLTDLCMDVTIFPRPDTVYARDTICRGESYRWKGSEFTDPNRYEYKIPAPGSCDSVFILDLFVIGLDPQIVGGDTLTCAVTDIVLDASLSDTILGTSFSWTLDGTVIGNGQFSRTVNIGNSGMVVLTLSANGCVEADSLFVPIDTVSPKGQLLIDTVSCNSPSAVVQVIGADPGLNVEWLVSGQLVATGLSWDNAPPGLFSTRWIGRNGCERVLTLSVPADTLPPQIDLMTDTLGCDPAGVWIRAFPDRPISAYQWDGPAVLESFADSARVGEEGLYTLQVRGQNGCDTSVGILVIRDDRPPEFRLSLDTLNCLRDTVFPNLLSLISGTRYVWNGPMGELKTGTRPALTLPGTYTLIASTPYGCEKDTTFELFADFFVPDVQLISDTLGCQPDSLRILSSILPAGNYLFEWSGPGGYSSNEQQPLIFEEGQYFLLLTGENGCQVVDSVVIYRTDDVPQIDFQVSGIDCIDTKGSILVNSPLAVSFKWSGPGGFASDQQDIQDLGPGVYRLTVTDAFGCQNSRSVSIAVDTALPRILLFGDTISCDEREVEVNFTSSGTLDSYFWRTPENRTITDSSFLVSTPGQYVFFARGRNGCTGSDTLNVLADTIAPIIIINADTITCDDRLADLSISSRQSLRSFEWVLPDGSIASSEILVSELTGTYYVTVTGENGCTFSDSLRVLSDTIVPALQWVADTITCLKNNAEVRFFPEAKVDSWSVSGPSGLFTDRDSFQLNLGGWYRIDWTGDNGCVGLDSFFIQADTMKPQFTVIHEDFDCREKDTLVLGVQMPDSLNTYLWSGPGAFTSNRPDTLTTVAGEYTLIVTAPNGCHSVETIEIDYDTLPPQWIFLPPDTITCEQDSIELTVRALSGQMRFAFDAPGGRLLNDSTWRTGTGGFIAVLAEGSNACIFIDSIEINVDTLHPDVSAEGGQLTCLEEQVELTGLVSPAGGSLLWTGVGGFTSTGPRAIVDTPGIYTLTYLLGNGCSASDTAIVVDRKRALDISLSGGRLPCDGMPAVLTVTADTSGVQFNWQGPGFRGSGDIVTVLRPGWYHVLAIDPAGCQKEDSIYLDYPVERPAFSIIGDTLTCANDSVDLLVVPDNEISTVEWRGPSGLPQAGAGIRATVGGWYVVTATDSLGCSTMDSFFVVTDTFPPVVSIVQQGEFNCGNDQVDLVVIFQGGVSGLEWSWIDPTGLPLADNDQRITITSPGNYRILVQNSRNGCSVERSILVRDVNNSPLMPSWQIIDPKCPGDNNGLIRLDSLDGAAGPVTIYFNGTNRGGISQFSALSAGTYFLRLVDSLGCEWSGELILMQPDTFWVDLGPDLSIVSGQNVLLSPEFNPGASGLRLVSWTPPDPGCPDCLEINVSPPRDTRYIIEVKDGRGCLASDDVWIRVRQRTPVFLPNAFTPNGDGVNDTWTISLGPEADRLVQLQIFDRWGGLVHSLENLALTDGMALWDGSTNGRALNPGVFAYRLTFKLANGKEVVLFGDITLIR